MIRPGAAASLVLLGWAGVCGAQRSIVDTNHNLSVFGPGQVRAASERRVCVFCHTPHNASPRAPLWNREDPGGSYQMYWSETLDAYTSSGQAPLPSGSSKLCLSCHDGTIALGSTLASGRISMSGGLQTLSALSPSHLGTDLTGDHPISFTITDELVATNNASGDVPLRSLAEMRSSPVIRLDSGDRLQCTSCHDAHDNSNGRFLLAAQAGELCIACHA